MTVPELHSLIRSHNLWVLGDVVDLDQTYFNFMENLTGEYVNDVSAKGLGTIRTYQLNDDDDKSEYPVRYNPVLIGYQIMIENENVVLRYREVSLIYRDVSDDFSSIYFNTPIGEEIIFTKAGIEEMLK